MLRYRTEIQDAGMPMPSYADCLLYPLIGNIATVINYRIVTLLNDYLISLLNSYVITLFNDHFITSFNDYDYVRLL